MEDTKETKMIFKIAIQKRIKAETDKHIIGCTTERIKKCGFSGAQEQEILHGGRHRWI